MRVSREKAAENRETIVEAAGNLFREKGFSGIGVADIMRAAGLTHGVFYGHFKSKDGLAAEASKAVMARSAASWAKTLAEHPDDALELLVDRYLSVKMRDDRRHSCIFGSLGADAARQGKPVRKAFVAAFAARSISAAPPRATFAITALSIGECVSNVAPVPASGSPSIRCATGASRKRFKNSSARAIVLSSTVLMRRLLAARACRCATIAKSWKRCLRPRPRITQICSSARSRSDLDHRCERVDDDRRRSVDHGRADLDDDRGHDVDHSRSRRER